MSHESTPICRCRVLYLGSSVPQQTKDGLQGIQEPLQELYPDQGATGARGIDSWLSVWSNGILLENVDEHHKKITRFFPIDSLHYCAAIRYVLVPEKNTLHNPSPRFLPLDSPFARAPNPVHPPLFAAILRRTSGIKVLECHAFICKREVAANALVRCCFHAYADSSYAKQVDGGGGGGSTGSIYGTLPSRRHTDDKMATRSPSGSTMTINTLGGHKDADVVSIYNGDENHKVWAGSQDHLDGGGLYDVYATNSSTISRPSRPRQMQQQSAVVPPPPPVKDKKKGAKPAKKSGGGKAHSVSGGGGSTLLKVQQAPPPPPPPPMYIVAHHHHHHPQTLPTPGKFLRQYGNTYSHRPRGKLLIPVTPILLPPPVAPPPGRKARGAPPAPSGGKTMEEPIYMPSARALSPIASYQPVTFPHEAYLMQQYATVESAARMRTKKEKTRMMKMAAAAASTNGVNNDQQPDEGENGGSPYSTGIYRKKGHLNERAFSYSIRQEHRSRSYGSLANLKFATPMPNGHGHHENEDREDMKKEREIMQMVHDLDLSGDELERSEVPRGMYESRALPAHAVQLNGGGGGRNYKR